MLRSSNIFISSGYSGNALALIPMAQSIPISFAYPRQEVNIIGKTTPLNNRNIINYTPVKYNIDIIKSNNLVENCFGLINPSGVAVNLYKSTDLVGYGCRNISNCIIDESNNQYKYSSTIISGNLQSYSLSATVGDIAKLSIVGEGLDKKDEFITGYVDRKSEEVIKSENIGISGIEFSGIGFSGVSIQGFNLNIDFSRQQFFKIGYKYPERKLISCRASISFNGFIDGLYSNHSIQNNDGFPETGTYCFTLVPTCNTYSPTTYTIKNPYIENVSFGTSIGSFISFSAEFSVPIPFSYSEILTGSNLIIS